MLLVLFLPMQATDFSTFFSSNFFLSPHLFVLHVFLFSLSPSSVYSCCMSGSGFSQDCWFGDGTGEMARYVVHSILQRNVCVWNRNCILLFPVKQETVGFYFWSFFHPPPPPFSFQCPGSSEGRECKGCIALALPFE